MRRPIFAIALAALVGWGTVVVAATAVLDQQQLAFNGSVSSPPSTFLAQTITAGLSGTLERATLRVANFAFDQALTLEVRDVDQTGAPGQTVLASQGILFPTPNTFIHEVDFDFAPAAVVAAGTQYALVLRSSGTGNFTSNGYAWLGSTDPLSYSKGSAWMFFFDSWHSSTVIMDFVFQTFVAPTPLTTKVRLDVKPDCLDIDSHGVVPIVIYGSATFDPSAIVLSTVRLAGASPAARINGTPMTSFADDDGDGYLDLKAKFRRADLKLSPTDTLITISGSLKTGEQFEGSDAVGPCGN